MTVIETLTKIRAAAQSVAVNNGWGDLHAANLAVEIRRLCDEVEHKIAEQFCPQCRKPFKLQWNDYSNEPMTLILRGCPSGGIYDVCVRCPHCDYEESL